MPWFLMVFIGSSGPITPELSGACGGIFVSGSLGIVLPHALVPYFSTVLWYGSPKGGFVGCQASLLPPKSTIPPSKGLRVSTLKGLPSP